MAWEEGRPSALGSGYARRAPVGQTLSRKHSHALSASSSTEVRNAPMEIDGGWQSKKKAPSEDGAYDLGPKSKSQVVASGEGGGYAVCRWIFAQGGGLGSDPVSQSRTEGGGYGAAHIDKMNMGEDTDVSNAAANMPAMQPAQVRSAWLTSLAIGRQAPSAPLTVASAGAGAEKTRPRSRGERGQSCRQD